MAAALRGLFYPDENKDGGCLDGNLNLGNKLDGFFNPAREKRLEDVWMGGRTREGSKLMF